MITGGDGSRELLVYDVRNQPPPPLLVDGWVESWTDGILQAESLTALLGQFYQQGWGWDWGELMCAPRPVPLSCQASVGCGGTHQS